MRQQDRVEIDVEGTGGAQRATQQRAGSRDINQMVAGDRYELYSKYPLQIQAVAASLATQK